MPFLTGTALLSQNHIMRTPTHELVWVFLNSSIFFSLMLIVICSLFAAFKSLVVSVLVQMCLDFSKLKWGEGGGEGVQSI